VNNAVANETVDNKMPPNERFQPTASLAALASRRLKRVPLGGLLDNWPNADISTPNGRYWRRWKN
jgi:hypothetical protein